MQTNCFACCVLLLAGIKKLNKGSKARCVHVNAVTLARLVYVWLLYETMCTWCLVQQQPLPVQRCPLVFGDQAVTCSSQASGMQCAHPHCPLLIPATFAVVMCVLQVDHHPRFCIW